MAVSRRLVLVAGAPSHRAGEHEFRAGALLLARCLTVVPGLTVDVHELGELPDLVPGDVDAIVVFSDGGSDHPVLKGDHLGDIDALVDSGVGLGLMHYAVDLPAGHGDAEVKRWIGGVYVTGLSCNPIWDASFERLPEHPVTRGVRPFTMNDEWYFNIQFAEVEQSTTHQAILVATPSDEVRGGPYVYPSGPYDHIVAASGRAETVMWTLERTGGGRSFGLTGGHFHANWGNESFRRLVLNALVWVTGAEVPTGGMVSSVSQGDLEMNLDAKPRT